MDHFEKKIIKKKIISKNNFTKNIYIYIYIYIYISIMKTKGVRKATVLSSRLLVYC